MGEREVQCPHCGTPTMADSEWSSFECSACGGIFSQTARTTFQCPSCTQSLEAPGDLAGKLVDCPHCGGPVEVPYPKLKMGEERQRIRRSEERMHGHRKRACPYCGEEILAAASKCKHCGSRIGTGFGGPGEQVASPAVAVSMVLGVLGGLVLILGVFSPIVHMPVMGSVNYFRNGEGDGVLILALAVSSIILSLSRRFAWLYLDAALATAVMAFTFFHIRVTLREMKAEMAAELADNPFREMTGAVVEMTEMQWGWGVLIVGVILLLLAASLKSILRAPVRS